MKSTENVLNLWVSFDANSVIIARFLYQVKTWWCLVPSRAAGAEWVRVKCGAGHEALCPVATPPPPHRQLPVVTSPPCKWAAWTLVTVTRGPGAWDIPKCRRCWWPHLHGAAEYVQRAEGGVQELLVSWGGWAPSWRVLGLCLGWECYICSVGLSPRPGFGGKGRGRDPRAGSPVCSRLCCPGCSSSGKGGPLCRVWGDSPAAPPPLCPQVPGFC